MLPAEIIGYYCNFIRAGDAVGKKVKHLKRECKRLKQMLASWETMWTIQSLLVSNPNLTMSVLQPQEMPEEYHDLMEDVECKFPDPDLVDGGMDQTSIPSLDPAIFHNDVDSFPPEAEKALNEAKKLSKKLLKELKKVRKSSHYLGGFQPSVYEDAAKVPVVKGSLKKRLKKKGVRLVKHKKLPKSLVKAKGRLHKQK